MCIGESTTALGGGYSYPNQLEEILNSYNLGRKFYVINKGIPGVSSSALVNNLERDISVIKPDMVVVMMGINDGKDFLIKQNRENGFYPLKYLKVYKLAIILKQRIDKKIQDLKSKQTGLNKPDMPVAEDDYMRLAYSYKMEGNYQRAEEMFNKAIVLSNNKEIGYTELGYCLRERGLFEEACKKFRDSIKTNSRHIQAYTALGCTYQQMNNHRKAEEYLLRAVSLDPYNGQANFHLGSCYFEMQDYISAERYLKRSAEYNPKDSAALIYLGFCYDHLNRVTEAESSFKKAIQIDPNDAKAYGGLATVYAKLNKHDLAKDCFEKIIQINSRNPNILTNVNYQKVKKALDTNKIKMVCVQYPTLSVANLKNIFPHATDIIFVDNEQVFKNALKQYGYSYLFVDMFAGSFGHCTKEGNEILARNIAGAIKEYIK
jgi:tetratricopeptide (TPR) repeat protein